MGKVKQIGWFVRGLENTSDPGPQGGPTKVRLQCGPGGSRHSSETIKTSDVSNFGIVVLNETTLI